MNGSDHYHGWLMMFVVYSALLFVWNCFIIIIIIIIITFICIFDYFCKYVHTNLHMDIRIIYIYIFANK